MRPTVESVVQVLASGPQELDAIFIGAGMSLNRRLYTPEVLKAAVKLFKGAPVYVDHPTLSEQFERPERSLRDLAGVILDARFDTFELEDGSFIEGIGGKLKVAAGAEWLVQLFEEDVHGGDLSIVAFLEGDVEGPEDKPDEQFLKVTNIERLLSVDFVTSAAAKGTLLETEAEAHPVYVQPEEINQKDIYFVDHSLGQALQITEDAFLVVESETFFKEEIQEEEDDETSSEEDSEEEPKEDSEEEPKEDSEEEPSEEEETEPTDRDSGEDEKDREESEEEDNDASHEEEGEEETFEDKVLAKLQSIEDSQSILSDRVDVLEEPSEEESAEEENEDAEAFADLVDNTIEEAIAGFELEILSISRIKRLAELDGVKSRAVAWKEEGKSTGQILELVKAEVETFIQEELEYVTRLASPRVTGLGGGQQTDEELVTETSNLDGVLENFGMIRRTAQPQ